MSLLKGFVNFLFEHSQTLQSYKENRLKLESDVQTLKKELNSTNKLLNNIYLDYELKPRPINQKFQELSTEFLIFMDNVCKKYDLEWMLEAGTLLGAVRHGGFIPWDDDIDTGMMREDYIKFINVIEYELEKNGLKNNVEIHYQDKYEFKGVHIGRFLQLFYFDETKIGQSLTGIDIFPYDFKRDYDTENYMKQYAKARKKYFKNLANGLDYGTCLKKYYNQFNLTYEQTPYIIQGVEGTQGKYRTMKPQAFNSAQILPFKRINFNGAMLPCAKDTDYYLTALYGDYHKIPKTVAFHHRMNRLRKTPGIYEILEKHVEKLKEVNKNFEY